MDLQFPVQKKSSHPEWFLSSQAIHTLTEQFGHSYPYRNSVVSITDERMRQLAEHFTP